MYAPTLHFSLRIIGVDRLKSRGVHKRHVSIVSRIFSPEVSAASGILRGWAECFAEHGLAVSVYTSQPPKSMSAEPITGVRVRRAAVIRDRNNYVRGIISYLSFDIPLFFRLLFARRPDLFVVEPPPTTVAVIRLLARLKRVPYVVRAADLWSDAASMVTRSRLLLQLLRAVEIWGLNGATHLFVAHEPLLRRLRELGIRAQATAIGFGADTSIFAFRESTSTESGKFVYAGTFSEWHGSGIFIEALIHVRKRFPESRILFVGNGQEREQLYNLAEQYGLSTVVEIRPPIPPSELVQVLADATASLASLKPGQGYDFAFTTKIYSSLAVGCPVVFSGVGPTQKFLQKAPHGAGQAVSYDPLRVADAMIRQIENPTSKEVRRQTSNWIAKNYSLTSIARATVSECLRIIDPRIEP